MAPPLASLAAPRGGFKLPESVLVVIHTVDHEVLLLERADHPGWWQSVTGSRDHADEPLVDTCLREVQEETGIVAAAGALTDWGYANTYEIYPAYRHRYAPGTMTNREHVFGLVVPRDVALVLAPREHTAWRWLPPDEAADACFSRTNAEAIRRLTAGR